MATKQIIDRAMSLNAANVFNVTNVAPYPLVPWRRGYKTREGDLVVSNVFTNNVWVAPESSFNSTVLSSGGTVDFWIREGQCDIIDSTNLKITLNNGSGSAITFPAIPQLIERVEVWCNKGSQLLSS